MSDWPCVGIADLEERGILQLGRGKVISKKDLAAALGNYPVYSSAKENDGKFGEYGHFMFDEELITWSVDGGGSLFHRPKHRFSITNVGGFVRILDKQAVECRYLYFVLSWLHSQVRFDWVRKAHPSVIRKVYTSFPLPPLEEQKRIVAVLDQALAALDRASTLAEANLTDAGELFEAAKRRFSSLGADQATPVSLGEVVSITAKLVDPKLPAYLDLPHIGAGNMVTGTDDLVEIQTAREEGLKSGKFPFAAGVVLYSKIRPYLRKVARPDFDGLCSADVYPLTPSKHIDRDYLFHLLLSEDFTVYAIAGSARAGMPKVNQDHLFAYTFDLPPVEAQRVIARNIDEALVSRKQLENLVEGKKVQLANLRQSLLQKAFAGELT
ncbi:hypothetical protein IP68_15270 [Blastomonas sp. AAP25]|uniref:restriction endonuclease subunit S n=1 Tax=Blastomonas sp. AAP25 TaxID=1523416 RepID=UPI0006B966D7|nr:restriction endonuclease subunit S [Blastomonas sp. AAP25]KPF73889.1 hypothetical protein IP68_15270 [Blastomonas sp. AAP25]